MNRPKATRITEVRSGFALIATLILMVLLAILAVGMLGLSSVVLRSSAQGEAQAQARASARLALMMAIGELQREMGPDSRISAPHDAGSPPPSGGRSHWTAVYDAWKAPNDPNSPETPGNRVPKFRGWLASGANVATGGTLGTGEEVTMVGMASLGASATAADQISVPMIAASAGSRSGRLAWWTADESQKAKLNAGPPNPAATNPLAEAQSPPHLGHKTFPELAGFDWAPGQRSIAISQGELNLAAKLGNAGTGSLNHGITLYSAGVLADVRLGRLRWDLTNVLSRPVAQLENKPLYTADGRMNHFTLSPDGSLISSPGTGANGTGANRWGINLEELHLFHEIHREVEWSTGKPRLVNKGSTAAMVEDRFFMYRRPTVEAVSLIVSFIASPEVGTSPTTYRIDANMDTIIALSNPNDIPTVWPSSVRFRVDTEGFPYRPKWNIRTATGTLRHGHTVQPINSSFFESSISEGFTLEPGEAAVFGASSIDTEATKVNLKRGYVPRGGVRIDDGAWNKDNNPSPNDGLRATGLSPTDKMRFAMIPAEPIQGNSPSGWIKSWVRISNTSGGGGYADISTHLFGGGGGSVLATAPTSTYTPASIEPQATSVPTIQEFIGKPLPVLMVTTMANVEKSRTDLLPPNALPSRPYLIHEPATSNMAAITNGASNTLLTMHSSQLVTIAESMDYKFANPRTMADSTGMNIYHGASREAGLNGSKAVVKRRIPLAPPLSLGAFENAIACGFDQRLGPSLNANLGIMPTMPAPRMLKFGREPQASMVTLAKSIGNSWSNPFLTSNLIKDGTHHDPSWLANTALWDSWFLSGIVAPNLSSGVWNSDSRSQKRQFQDLATGTATLRNARLSYHPHKSLGEAVAELFDGELIKPTAINKLAKYLLVDGAFNVNSTSLAAWKAFLSSVKDQQLLDADGAAQKKSHPFGTLGYAVSAATSGNESDWNGFRDLTDAQIDSLAQAIVVEVKARGPFLNMADFVNRRPNAPDAAHKALGALQAAIDKSGINDTFKDAGRALAETDVQMLAGKDTLTAEPTAARAIGAAGFLSQAAVLTAFGSQITVRGDTFLIRTYGDSRDAAGKIQAKAWCEAVVQRTPEYVDPMNLPEASDVLTDANKSFGRKFHIVSFRWLSEDEI